MNTYGALAEEAGAVRGAPAVGQVQPTALAQGSQEEGRLLARGASPAEGNVLAPVGGTGKPTKHMLIGEREGKIRLSVRALTCPELLCREL